MVEEVGSRGPARDKTCTSTELNVVSVGIKVRSPITWQESKRSPVTHPFDD